MSGQPLKFAPELLAEMQRLWEDAPELSAKDIGERLGVSKSTVIGQAHRRGWTARGEPTGKEPTTVFTRLANLDAFPPSGGCVYPIGHPRTEGFRFCCAAVTEIGAPYCAEHNRKCWNGGGATWGDDPERRLKAAAKLRALNERKARGGAA